MIESGALSAAIQAMALHAAHLQVQVQGCTVLRNVSSDLGFLERIEEENGIARVASAMRSFASQPMVMHLGCSVFEKMAASSTSLKWAVLNHGGLKCVVYAVRRHMARTPVAERALAALCNVAQGDDSIKMEVLNERGLEVIRMAMVEAQDSVAVLIQACAAIANLALGSTAVKEALMREIDAGMIMKVLNAHSESAALQEVQSAPHG